MQTMFLRNEEWRPDRAATPMPGRRARRRLVERVVTALRAWRARRLGRFELARLDARMLRDIGVTPAEAWFEIQKPFWRE
jgi:uncharacterized protein YjiS (DUF1127 family)